MNARTPSSLSSLEKQSANRSTSASIPARRPETIAGITLCFVTMNGLESKDLIVIDQNLMPNTFHKW
jgi:hypothetical protein